MGKKSTENPTALQNPNWHFTVKTAPGSVYFTRNQQGRFDYIGGAHGANYRGTCGPDVVAMIAWRRSRYNDSVDKLKRFGWSDVLAVYEAIPFEAEKFPLLATLKMNNC